MIGHEVKELAKPQQMCRAGMGVQRLLGEADTLHPQMLQRAEHVRIALAFLRKTARWVREDTMLAGSADVITSHPFQKDKLRTDRRKSSGNLRRRKTSLLQSTELF